MHIRILVGNDIRKFLLDFPGSSHDSSQTSRSRRQFFLNSREQAVWKWSSIRETMRHGRNYRISGVWIISSDNDKHILCRSSKLLRSPMTCRIFHEFTSVFSEIVRLDRTFIGNLWSYDQCRVKMTNDVRIRPYRGISPREFRILTGLFWALILRVS